MSVETNKHYQTIIRFFYTLKPWQAFVLFLALPFIFEAAELLLLARRPGGSGLTMLLMAVNLMLGLMSLTWFLLLSVDLRNYIPEEIRPANRLLYISVAVMLILSLYFELINPVSFGNSNFDITNLILILTGLFFILYLVFYASRNIAILKRNRAVTKGESINIICFFAILPIGIWFIQKDVNEIYEKSVADG